MDTVAIAVGIGWTFVGVLCVLFALPLLGGKVGRNRIYGVRFRESFESDEAWYAINRYGGRRMILWAAPVILIGVIAFFLPLRAHPGVTLAMGFGPLVFVLMPVVESWRFARRWGRERGHAR